MQGCLWREIPEPGLPVFLFRAEENCFTSESAALPGRIPLMNIEIYIVSDKAEGRGRQRRR